MITLQEAKAHTRVDEDMDREDLQILDMIATAKAHIENYLGRAFPVGEDVPAPVKSAALLLFADLYENREGQQDVVLYTNRTFALLLNPYRLMSI
ncbi:head-tail connector protein [Herbaspirillum autotrophicum]|uniref:head-tail connector protein n=1 Tax=Herbaspirillum autotrophicum TaxID=180195 RepID=UPI00067E2A4E|nr:head-tail connector protein [Herbaspirillum autotrophicum]